MSRWSHAHPDDPDGLAYAQFPRPGAGAASPLPAPLALLHLAAGLHDAILASQHVAEFPVEAHMAALHHYTGDGFAVDWA